jgi:hypothetical protein
VDPGNKLIVLAFRGSDSYTNVFYADNNPYQTSTDFTCSGCAIGDGFWAAYIEARPIWLPSLNAQRSLNPTYKLVTTGHSLGGVLAHVAAAQLRASGIQIDLVCNS